MIPNVALFPLRKRELEYELHSISSINGDFESEIISLIDDSKMEGVSRDSFYERASSSDSLEAIFSVKADRGELLLS